MNSREREEDMRRRLDEFYAPINAQEPVRTVVVPVRYDAQGRVKEARLVYVYADDDC